MRLIHSPKGEILIISESKILFSSNNFTYQEKETTPVAGSKLLCPVRYTVRAENNRDLFEGEIKVTHLQEKKELIADLPLFIRPLAKSIMNESWLYRFWCDFNFKLNQAGETILIQGIGTGQYLGSLKNQSN